MPPKERDFALLWDMRSHAREVSAFIACLEYEEYRDNQMLKLAVERLVQNIGEAAYKVSRPFRDATPQIPWIPIMSQRHIHAALAPRSISLDETLPGKCLCCTLLAATAVHFAPDFDGVHEQKVHVFDAV